MDKKILLVGLVFGILSIVLGAFAAHGLKSKLEVSALQSFETGVKYQMYMALFLLFIAVQTYFPSSVKFHVFWTALLGTLLFSGSIYLLSTQAISQINFKKIGFITPIGGLFMIVSWCIPLIHILTAKK